MNKEYLNCIQNDQNQFECSKVKGPNQKAHSDNLRPEQNIHVVPIIFYPIPGPSKQALYDCFNLSGFKLGPDSMEK